MQLKTVIQSAGLVCALAYTTNAYAFLETVTGISSCTAMQARKTVKKGQNIEPTAKSKQCALNEAAENPNFSEAFKKKWCATKANKTKWAKYCKAIDEAMSGNADEEEETLDEELE